MRSTISWISSPSSNQVKSRPDSPEPPGGAENSMPVTRLLRRIWLLFTGQTARGGAAAAADQAILSLTNFLAAVLLGRSVEPIEFGVYAVGYLALHLARAVQEGVLIQPLSALAPGMDEGAFRRHVTGAAVLQVAAAVASSLAALSLGAVLLWTGNDVAGPTVLSLWFVLLTWQPQEFLRRVFYARGRVNAAVANTLVASAVRLAVLAIALRAGAVQGEIGLHAIGWGALAGLFLGIFQIREVWTRAAVSVTAVWRSQWALGRWVMAATIGNWLTLEVYPLLTAGLVSFAAAGAYRALQTIVAPVHAYLRTIDTFFTPRIAMLYDRAGRSAVRRQLLWLYGLGGVPIGLGLAVVLLEPARLLRWFYGTTYAAFSTELTWMAVFYGLWFAYAPLQIALKAVRRTRPIFVANAISLTLMLTVGVAAIRVWGVLGTVIGQALGALVVGVFLWFGWRRWLGDPSQAAPVSVSTDAAGGARSGASGPARVANEARTPPGTRPPEA